MASAKTLKDTELARFRTVACERGPECEFFQQRGGNCTWSHNDKWMRRNPYKIGYRPVWCTNVRHTEDMELAIACTDRLYCLAAHTWEEVWYHPCKYKTQRCDDYERERRCPRTLCPFAHGAIEIRSPPNWVPPARLHQQQPPPPLVSTPSGSTSASSSSSSSSATSKPPASSLPRQPTPPPIDSDARDAQLRPLLRVVHREGGRRVPLGRIGQLLPRHLLPRGISGHQGWALQAIGAGLLKWDDTDGGHRQWVTLTEAAQRKFFFFAAEESGGPPAIAATVDQVAIEQSDADDNDDDDDEKGLHEDGAAAAGDGDDDDEDDDDQDDDLSGAAVIAAAAQPATTSLAQATVAADAAVAAAAAVGAVGPLLPPAWPPSLTDITHQMQQLQQWIEFWDRSARQTQQQQLAEVESRLRAAEADAAALRRQLDHLLGRGLHGLEREGLDGLERQLEEALAAVRAHRRAEEDEKRRCKICEDRPWDTAVVPCGHTCCCAGCIASLDRCPLCQGQIELRLRLWLS